MPTHPLRFRHSVTLAWTWCLLVLAFVAAPAELAASTTAAVTTLTVTTSQDRSDGNTGSFSTLVASPGGDGKISLAEALRAANNTAAGSTLTIQFDLPVPPPPTSAVTITLSQPLPAMTRGNVRVDASTQPQNLRVVLDGRASSRSSSALLTITSANNELRGLTIHGFFNDGMLLQSNASGNRILDCAFQANGHNGITFSGTGVTQNVVSGSTLAKNSASGIEFANGASQNTLGGSETSLGNSISQNAAYGVLVRGNTTRENVVGANSILGNGNGIALYEQSAQTMVARNVVGQSQVYGVWVDSSTRNTFAANSIGLAADGLTPLPNSNAGVLLSTNAISNTLGGSESGRNLIGANVKEGVVVFGSQNTISYNYIGVGADGTTALGNQSYGIRVSSAGPANRIEANMISANASDGVRLDSQNNVLVNNRIGVGANAAPLPNGAAGVAVRGANNVVGPGNLVANHVASGIYITGSDAQVSQNIIEANRRGICIDADNAQISENLIQFNGVAGQGSECGEAGGGVLAKADNAAVMENVIQNNIGSGVLVLSGSGNRVQENSISNNTEEGIVLGPGANGERAAPRLSDVSATVIAGGSCPACRVELFADDGDQGRALIGATDADGAGAFALSITRAMLTGTFVTATATDAEGNTSAFATPFRVPFSVSWRAEQVFVPLAWR